MTPAGRKSLSGEGITPRRTFVLRQRDSETLTLWRASRCPAAANDSETLRHALDHLRALLKREKRA